MRKDQRARYALSSQQIQPAELSTQHRGRGRMQSMFQQGGINAAEVGVVHEVAAFEFGQAGMLADEAALQRATEEEERGGRAAERMLGLARVLP